MLARERSDREEGRRGRRGRGLESKARPSRSRAVEVRSLPSDALRCAILYRKLECVDRHTAVTTAPVAAAASRDRRVLREDRLARPGSIGRQSGTALTAQNNKVEPVARRDRRTGDSQFAPFLR